MSEWMEAGSFLKSRGWNQWGDSSWHKEGKIYSEKYALEHESPPPTTKGEQP